MKRAAKLVTKLQNNITTGRVQICENYGQRQIRRFIDNEISPQDDNLTYQEQCNIKAVLYEVSNIC